MIILNCLIANPWQKEKYKLFVNKHFRVTKNKTFEIECYRYFYNLFELTIDLRWFGHDHAGFKFELNILGLNLGISLCDNRHWDHKNNCWEKNNDEHTNC